VATFYISSTFEDLKECRAAVSTTLRQMGHQVEGMENYTADGRAPLEKCLDDVAKCHAYIGVLAWRYGYVPREGNLKKLSITELEYREARRLGRETLIFILDKDADWPGNRYDEDRKRIIRLRKELEERHTVSHFKDCNELAARVSVVVSKRFPSVEDERLPPPLPSPPPPPLPWKWLVVAAAVAVLAFVGYRVKSTY
jgi:hypothetical protein